MLPRSVRALAFVLLLGFSSGAFAQTEKGSIAGTVKDTTGGVLPGATVTVTNDRTGFAQSLVTNANGAYEAPFLDPSTYTVRVALAGFQDAAVTGVVVNVGSRARADVVLTVPGVAAEVTVRAVSPLVQTQSATVGQVLDSKALVELPSGDRNVFEFLTLNSNVTAPPGGNAVAFRLESGGSFAVSGTRPSSLTFKTDGLANTDPGFGTPTITPSLDSIHEFQVQNNAYSAEYEGIGQVNVATKSGSNVFSGSLFEYLRNEALQPVNPVLNRRTRLRFNQFGGTLGGPLWTNGFFFASYEGRRMDTLNVGQAYVPTAANRGGDFSADLGACVVTGGATVPLLLPTGLPSGDCVRQGQIFDPATTVANPMFDRSKPASALNPQFIRQPFAGNRIPASRISDAVRRMIEAQLPLPNFGDGANNFTGTAGILFDNDQYSVRLDQAFSADDRIYARLAIQNNLRTSQPLLRYLGKNLQGKGRVFSSTWTRVVSNALVNELRAGYVRGVYGDSIDEIAPAEFGIRNTTLQTLPRLFVSTGNLNYGGFSGSVIAETQDTYQLADNVSWVRGGHALKAGFQLDYNQFNNTEFFGSNGTATFSGLYTLGNSGLTASRTNALADLLLGTAQAVSLNRAAVADIQNMPWAIYVQDDWRVSDRLTLTAGLRYEFHQMWKSSAMGGAAMDLSGNGRLLVVDPEVVRLSDTPLVVQSPYRRGIAEDRNDFAPRVSAIFRPFERDPLVVRAGYGLYYSGQVQFFNWRSYEPLRGRFFQGRTGDFVNPAATTPDLFPDSQFTDGGGVRPFNQSGIPAAIHGPQVIGASGVLLLGNRTPYSHQWSVSVQREILPRTLLDITYQGSVGRNLPTQWIFNQPPASPTAVSFTSPDPAANPFLRRPYACCSSTSFVNANILESEYNALTIKIDKRFDRGYQLLSTYTFSRSIDQGSEVFQIGNTFNILSDSRNIDRDRGRSTFDVPHRWVTSGMLELPFGQGKALLDRGGWVNAIVGGWRLSGVFTLQSGFPFTPLIRNRRANTGYVLATERGDLVGEPYFSDEEWERRVEEWKNGDGRLYIINPASISLDYAPGTFGNIPRNFFRTPFGRRLDLSLAKTGSLPRGMKLQIRADVINATSERLHRMDLSQFVFANNLLTHPFVGSIPPYKNMFNPRIIQLGLRLVF